jgi:hypothetical protein
MRLATSLAEIGVRGDAPRRRAPQRVDDDQQFHQMVVGGIGGRLDHEHVGAAHVLQDLNEDFHVGKPPDHRLGHRCADVFADRLGQNRIGIAGDELDRSVLARHPPLSCAARIAARNPGKSNQKPSLAVPSDKATAAAPITPNKSKNLIQAVFGAGNMNQKLSPDGFSPWLVMG